MLPIILGGSTVMFSTRFALGRIGIAAGLPLCALLTFGCASTKPTVSGDTPSAEELYRKGLSLMEGPAKTLWVFPNSDHAKAIEAFQQIIDNYPYSDYAILAELKIADAYYDDGKYDEALSYYRDFGDLHPQHEQVPYTLFRAAMCHYQQSKDASRDQTATRLSLGFLDQLLARYPHSPQAPEAEKLWPTTRCESLASTFSARNISPPPTATAAC
jgi:outer membrane protein assembly factor BamD